MSRRRRCRCEFCRLDRAPRAPVKVSDEQSGAFLVDFSKEDRVGALKERLRCTGRFRPRSADERRLIRRQLRHARHAQWVESRIIDVGRKAPRERRERGSRSTRAGPDDSDPHLDNFAGTARPAEGGGCSTATGLERAAAPGHRRDARRAARPLRFVSFAEFLAEDLGRG